MRASRPAIFYVGFSLLFALYYLIGLSGYGNDFDTYRMIKIGKEAILHGAYTPSRPPGYFVPEMVIGAASLLGGFYLSNFISALFGTLTLYFFWRLLRRRFTDGNAFLITLIIGLNPHFIIASSSSMDYVYSLFFIFSGILLLDARKNFWAAPVFALAVSSRLSNVLIIVIIYLYYLVIRYRTGHFKEVTQTLLSAFCTSLGTAALFVPCFIAHNYTLGFLTYLGGGWNFSGHLSRFVYKNIYLFGLLPFAALAGSLFYAICRRKIVVRKDPVLLAGLSIFLVHEALFFKVPIEISYLLPLLFVVIPLWVILVQPGKRLILGLLILSISYGFFHIDILDKKYDSKGSTAIAADPGIFLRPGLLVDDFAKRKETQQRYLNKI